MTDRNFSRTCGFLVAILLLGAPAVWAQTTWCVDDDAAHDPGPGDPTIGDSLENGSWEHPFDAIREAVDEAALGDEIVVLDGVYKGPGNKRIFVREGISIRSQHGPQSCIIDLEGIGYGFYFIRHETHDARLEGFTIQNGESGIKCSYSNPIIHRCIIRGHVVKGSYAGGINGWQSGPKISHCLIDGNIATDSYGGGISIYNNSGRRVEITNCIVSNNVAAEEGGGNLDLDPLFVDADGPDNDPNTWRDNDNRLSGASPSIDAGSNYLAPTVLITDLDDRLRFADRVGTPDTGLGDSPLVDMGAYEFQCTGDLDGNGAIDLTDLETLLINHHVKDTLYACGDLDRDGDVDLSDLAALLGAFGTTCE